MNSNVPIVSVIIPSYGRPNLLLRAVTSVLNQDYKSIEIIVVDDNEPKSRERVETQQLLKPLIDKGQIIYFKMKKNSGGALARNKGVELSNGSLICFLDDDDEFLKSKIRMQVEKFRLSNTELAVVGGFANILDINSRITRIERTEVRGNVFKHQLCFNICTTSIAMINSEVFKKVGGFSNVPSSQEHTLFIKIFNENPNYDFINQPVVNIYHHEGARISTSPRKIEGTIRLFEYVQTYYNELTGIERRRITSAHLNNIIKAQMSIDSNRLVSIKYLFKLLKNDKKINKEFLKSLIIIVFGYEYIRKLKRKI